MKKKFWILAFSVGLFFLIGGYFFEKSHHEMIDAAQKMYCYEEYFGAVNPVIILEDESHKEDYIEYYKNLSVGKVTSFSFPLKTLPISHEVSVISVTEDSLLADVISTYNRGTRLGGSYLRGWVYFETLHFNPPSKQ